MVFNSGSKLLQCANGFKLGNLDVLPTRKYCYLGIMVSLNGSFKHAVEELRKKALRAFFAIRRILDTTALTTCTMLKLIDSLVKPVAMYSCQIWLPSSSIMRELIKPGCSNIPKCAAKDPFETTHLKMLKWIFGVHKKTTNNFCYGDSGRVPWALSVIPQCIRYFERVSMAVAGPNCVNTLIHHTFQEQKTMKLSWYNTWSVISSQHANPTPTSTPGELGKGFHSELFISQWKDSIFKQNKMNFYRQVKVAFGQEPYLALNNKAYRSHIARLRSSSHDLMIEKGRYGVSDLNLSRKSCRFCCNTTDGTMEYFECLPFCEKPIVESEEHVLTECPYYHPQRVSLSDNLKSLLMLKEYGLIMSSHHMTEFGRYLLDCYHIRHPKKQSTTLPALPTD